MAQMMMRSALSMEISQAVPSALLKTHVKCSKFIKQQNCILTKLISTTKESGNVNLREGLVSCSFHNLKALEVATNHMGNEYPSWRL